METGSQAEISSSHCQAPTRGMSWDTQNPRSVNQVGRISHVPAHTLCVCLCGAVYQGFTDPLPPLCPLAGKSQCHLRLWGLTRGSVVDVEIVQVWGLDSGDTRVPPTPGSAQGQWTVLGGTEVSEYNKGRCLGILAWGPLLKPGLDLLAISGNPMDRQVLLPSPCLLLCQNPGNGTAMTESIRAEPRELLCQIWRP